MLEDKITTLKKSLIEFAALAEEMIEKSINGLLRGEAALLEEVLERQEPLANRKEVELDEACTSLIAQHQPTAGDLRKILMILKINNDLERLGDHAVNIAQSARFLIERPPVKPLIDIPLMARTAVGMLKDSVNSFINEDPNLADSVCERDNKVDDLRDKVLRELITYMSADPGTIPRAIQLIVISRNLERVADLSTNIAEDVIFMVEGKVIKHGHGK